MSVDGETGFTVQGPGNPVASPCRRGMPGRSIFWLRLNHVTVRSLRWSQETILAGSTR